ncbi:MAG: NAD-dependent epimerase/dehydratase family protein [Verrucomicrobia bacterium]|nr:NAD-dependent epimerase/dehydratase family protein [Verrucomicrobiota bacterium]
MKSWILCFAFLLNLGLHAQKTALVCGAGGFIGTHLVTRYKEEGYWVRGVDIKYPEFSQTDADEFILADLRFLEGIEKAFGGMENPFDEVCQLAANMGGMGFIAFHDAEIMHDSVLINVNVLEKARETGARKIFYTSSACIYPEYNQLDPENPNCREDSAYPAAPDTEYGWEKLFSERLYLSYARDYGMDVRIVRLHNVFGPLGAWCGGREKAPAALCRKVAEAKNGGNIEIWGKGDQTRSFLYITECIEGIRRVMLAETPPPVLNLGSDECISINDLAHMVARIAGKDVAICNIPGPEGVRGRNSDNHLIEETLGWRPNQSLEMGFRLLYPWIEAQVMAHSSASAVRGS